MKIINPSVEVISPVSKGGVAEETLIEYAARTCYQSQAMMSKDQEERREFLGRLRESGHHSPFEHVSVSVKFVTNRGVTHELVRHRLASFCQESTRYCNYGRDRFGVGIAFVRPADLVPGTQGWAEFEEDCADCERRYLRLIGRGVSAQSARYVLNNAVRAELVMTCNVREWWHVFDMRDSIGAHPDMHELMSATHRLLASLLPGLFDYVEF